MLLFITHATIFSTPVNNYQDPVIFHTVAGSDKFYSPTQKAGLTLHISPFYQHTKSASKLNGTKTSNGNVRGPWNMAGVFLNAPNNLGKSFDDVKKSLDPALIDDGKFNADVDPYRSAMYQEVPLRYEKLGLRGQLNFDLGAGLGMAVKGGIVNMKNRADAFVLQEEFAIKAKIIPAPAGSSVTPFEGDELKKAKALYDSLLSPAARRKIFSTLNLDANDFELTDLEDLFGNIYWHVPIKIKDNGEHVFNIIPYLSVGASAAIGRERDYRKLFFVINGNDGFNGFTAEAALALDFPDMMQISFGGGATTHTSRSLKNYPIPTSYNQSGIYPTSASSVTITPGPTWYVNLSMKAENIMSKKDIPNFSVYFDYVYEQHKRDVFRIDNTDKKPSVDATLGALERDSSWKAQILHAGVKCALSKNVALTFAAQKSLPGARAYRPTTLLGGLAMHF